MHGVKRFRVAELCKVNDMFGGVLHIDTHTCTRERAN